MSGAVFLSYAREDAAVARGITEALRSTGVEVWFDENELHGGDVWDGKIRKQIKECALFVPVVSKNTEARIEGYFRREWKLAAERTHDMAASRAFLLPIVIDETRETDAEVPDEFLRVQWTRLDHGAPSPDFVARVKLLRQSPRTEPNPDTDRARPAEHSDDPRSPQPSPCGKCGREKLTPSPPRHHQRHRQQCRSRPPPKRAGS